MRADLRASLLATAIFTSLTGIALAESDAGKDAGAGQVSGHGDAGVSIDSIGAGGLTGTGATKDGARTGASSGNPTTDSAGSSDASHRGSSASPAPGTTR
jgi:hypothetical protein